MKLKNYFFLLIFFLTTPLPTAEAGVPVVSENSRVNYLLDQAAQARSDSDLPGAIGYYQQAIETEPKNYLLHRNLGVLYYEGQNYVEALKSLLKANQLNPNETFTMVYTARALLKTGDAEGALPYLDIAHQESPDNPVVYIARGEVLAQLRKVPDAESAFEEALELEPGNPEALSGLGQLNYEIKRYEQAQTHFEEALKSDPTNGNLWFNLGMTYYALDDLNKAAECMHRSLTYDPNNAKTFNALGLIFQKARLWSLAEKSYSKALTIDPDYGVAQKNLQSLPWKKQEAAPKTSYRGRVPPRASPEHFGAAAVTKVSRPAATGPSDVLAKDHRRPGYDHLTGYDPRIGYADAVPDDGIDKLAAIGNALLKGLFGKDED